MREDMLKGIIDIARSIDAWVLCDEVYRHLTQNDGWSESVADLYEKGISTGSMSKAFSLAGLRSGWIATHDKALVKSMLSHRDYDLISGSVIDEMIAGIALSNSDKLLARSKAIVRESLGVLDEWVNSEKHVSYVRPEAGTTSLIYYDFDIPSREFCRNMYYSTGAFVVPGERFGIEHSFRLGYAYGIDNLKKGLAAVSEYMRSLEK